MAEQEAAMDAFEAETDHMIDARRFDGEITANADGCHSDVFAESCEV